MPDSAPIAVCIGEGLISLVAATAGPLEDCRTFHRSLAGAEWNAAIALASAGIRTAVVSRVGDDGFGRFLTDELRRHGVDDTAVEVDPDAPTGLYVKELVPRPDGAVDGAMHYYRTASAASAMSPDTLASPAASAVLDRAALVHLSGITPALSDSALAAQEMLFAERRTQQVLSFDLNWRPALWRGRETEGRALLTDFAHRADIVFCTGSDAAAVFGTADPQELRELLAEPRYLVLTDPGGAVAFDGTERADSDAVDTAVVETVGAGDAFAAGFLAGILTGLSLTGSLARAHRIAARALASTRDHIG
ncbi:2-dehydro-3-deoxygluconokinase [Microbacterium oxydans]|uniref:2-dehydro-3-deoxygluconokinase n=1 Tax=Microbacterium oxydans TaxID=82380 RepID=A0A0F0LAD3_9MICO|nr:sugar kinase [Microbacterium oxydans]KJL29225.1 2-dehydro-3-deoxygluconokinase [Microbacterium oxydans]CAH0197731.1 2-dehydro-3-deoxygluconokinase [Microbacterium oxydans]